jgi:hypothetical protein
LPIFTVNCDCFISLRIRPFVSVSVNWPVGFSGHGGSFAAIVPGPTVSEVVGGNVEGSPI